ncbi:ABC transporter substrate binding protein [Croceitalea sp. P059]|uniref:ABC transporter substrate binding protein n=1 Tax=Croceitalea sp. P059 TaxID=3075601 RepID=UPI002888C8E9|nr:ABC transporter substrate binding protein [Croceitalea sp. P059]MDT0540709.1 ABC transporter substrate binding protein [Croceitalea sp. P059]
MRIHKYLLLTLALVFSIGCYAQKEINIGVVTDVQNRQMALGLLDSLQSEIQKTVGSDYSIKINPSNIINGITNKDESLTAYTKINATSVDIIFVLGPKSLSGISQNTVFSKPTIVAGVLDYRLQFLPKTENGTSGKNNFTYIETSTDLITSIKKFKELVDFESLSLVVDSDLISIFDEATARYNILEIENELNIKIKTIAVDEANLESFRFPEDVQAAFLLFNFQYPKDNLNKIIEQLELQKTPSFSTSKEQVTSGVLFGLGDDIEQIKRKIALTVDETLEGFSLSEMPVSLNLKQELFVNLSTAKKIQFPLTYQLVFTAHTIENDKNVISYSLTDILTSALNENLDIKISQQDIQNSTIDIDQAISNYYPDLDASVSYTELSKNQSSDIIGQSQRSASGNLSLSQVIFSESILANIKTSKYLLEAQKYNTQQDILDVIFDTYSGYFSILQNQASLDIQNENLQLSKTNLDLAKLKKSLGAADNSDVYRFEGEVASNTQLVIEAQANTAITKLGLNQLLNYTLEDEFEIADSSTESEVFTRYKEHPILEAIKSPIGLKKLASFLVLEAQKSNPTGGELLANKNILERQLKLNKRQFYLPTLSASGNLNSTFLRGGMASSPSEGFEFADDTWNVGLTLNYPIFDGTQRKLDKQQTLISLDQTELSIENFNQNIKLAIQNSLISLFTSYTDLDYSKTALENQEQNFKLNQNKYRVGQVSIVQLLDAQNALVQAKQNYAFSTYSFIQQFLQLEYNLGYFSSLATPEQLQDFEFRLLEFLNK